LKLHLIFDTLDRCFDAAHYLIAVSGFRCQVSDNR
jgi:hypothetical protein